MRLFWAQIGLGIIAGLGSAAGLLAVDALAPLAIPCLLAWLAMSVAGLYALERRKASPPALLSAEGWVQHVHSLRDSRLQIVNAFEMERRRIERDLHDGTQQYLVATSIKVGEATLLLERTNARSPAKASELLLEAQDAVDAALAALRQTVAGIHPAVLSNRGLEAAVRDLTDRCPAQVNLRVPHQLPPIPEPVAAAMYFFVAEALTNVAKHAPGATATVLLAADDELHASIVDNGVGGAVIQPGQGLAGITERFAAFGGTLLLSSPQDGPTSVSAKVPLLLPEDQPSAALAVAPQDQQCD